MIQNEVAKGLNQAITGENFVDKDTKNIFMLVYLNLL